MSVAESRRALAQLAGDQWGLLTTAQATAAGVSKMQLSRMVHNGELERVEHGVYATPTGATAEYAGLRAQWLALDPRRTAEERLSDPHTAGVASHTTAARLHDIGDLPDDVYEMTVPTRRQTRRAGLRIHVTALDPAHVTLVEGLPTTTVERTIADLVRDGHDLSHVAHVLRDAVRAGHTTAPRTHETLRHLLHEKRTEKVWPTIVHAAQLDVDSTVERLIDSDLGEALTTAVARRMLPGLGDLYLRVLQQAGTAAAPPRGDGATESTGATANEQEDE